MQSPFVNDLLLQNAYYECPLKQNVDYHSHFANVQNAYYECLLKQSVDYHFHFANVQNAYYECPSNKVWTIIPTLQMLVQMNIKEGSNKIITFTFFTPMLGNKRVAFNI